MVKKSKKKEQRALAVELHKKRRMSKPAIGRTIDNSFNWVKDKDMRSELVDKARGKKKKDKAEIRRGRIACEKRGEDYVAAGFPGSERSCSRRIDAGDYCASDVGT